MFVLIVAGIMADIFVVERESYVCKKMHRGRPDFHWSSMAGHRVHGEQKVRLEMISELKN
jgi:hypothetical protein